MEVTSVKKDQTKPGFWKKTWKKIWAKIKHRRPPKKVIEHDEIAALIKYASEQGIDTDDHLVTRLHEALEAFKKDESSETSIIVENDKEERILNSGLVLRHYTQLTKLTEGVNGKNVLYGECVLCQTKMFVLFTFFTFVVCVTSLGFADWVNQDVFEFENRRDEMLFHFLQFFTPFFWGALGACVYILKRITDEARNHRFDPYKFKGWLTRMTLGAVLGGSITFIVDPETFGEVTFSATAIAFLTGLGTKVIYGGLERIINLLVEKFNLGVIREKKPDKDAIARFLAEQLGGINAKDQPEEYRVLVKLLEDHGQSRKFS